jgi:hypothetical protein
MKFLVLMTEADHFARWDSFSEAEQQAVFESFHAFDRAVETRGSVVGGEALRRPAEALTLLPGAASERAVTEGPYAETVEQLGGFYLIDVENLDEAIEWAKKVPIGDGQSTEVRPVMDYEAVGFESPGAKANA